MILYPTAKPIRCESQHVSKFVAHTYLCFRHSLTWTYTLMGLAPFRKESISMISCIVINILPTGILGSIIVLQPLLEELLV
jgi:hypothetical protein